MLKIKFPLQTNQRYYSIHFKYLLNLLKFGGCDISYYTRKDDALILNIEGKEFNFDYWDDALKENTSNLPGFKFHCIQENVTTFAFSPVSFYDWGNYSFLRSQINYGAKGNISYRQRPYANAQKRRMVVRQLLQQNFGDLLLTPIPQEDYWREINNCLVTICVPGFCNNMLDRGQFQYMALGACTISPKLPEVLPFGYRIIAGSHYLKCADDYSDLVDIVQWCKENSAACIAIGLRAKALFLATSTPSKLINWIITKL
jgi:hypothetical protein